LTLANNFISFILGKEGTLNSHGLISVGHDGLAMKDLPAWLTTPGWVV